MLLRHDMMLAVPLLVLAAALRPAFAPIAVAVGAICALNINMFYGIGRGWGWTLPRAATPIETSVLLAAVNVGALAWHGRVLARSSRQ